MKTVALFIGVLHMSVEF